MVEFAKSLIIEFIVTILVFIVTWSISPFIPTLTELRISLAYTIIIVTIIAFIISVLYHFQIQQMKNAKPRRIGVRKFSCVKCGEPFDAFPPDDVFIIGNLSSKSTNRVTIEYECVNHHKTTIYWTALSTEKSVVIGRPTVR